MKKLAFHLVEGYTDFERQTFKLHTLHCPNLLTHTKKNLRFQIAAKLVDLLCNLVPNYSNEVMMIISSRFTFRREFGENSCVGKNQKKNLAHCAFGSTFPNNFLQFLKLNGVTVLKWNMYYSKSCMEFYYKHITV